MAVAKRMKKTHPLFVFVKGIIPSGPAQPCLPGGHLRQGVACCPVAALGVGCMKQMKKEVYAKPHEDPKVAG